MPTLFPILWQERFAPHISPPRRVVAGLFYAHFVWLHLTYSQRLTTSFGPYSELPCEKTPVAMTLNRTPSRAQSEIIVGFQDSRELHVFTMTDSLMPQFSRSLVLSRNPGSVWAAEIDGVKGQECLVLAESGESVSILHLNATTIQEDIYELGARPQRAALGDFNSDGRHDILLFGQSMSGVLTLAGRPGGKCVSGPVLFPEVSVSDLWSTDLNGDHLTDIILVDWLSQKLLVNYGVGRGLFSQQASVSLPGEPQRLSVMPVTSRRTFRIAVSLPREQGVAHILGTALGDFRLKETIPVKGTPKGVMLGLVNEDMLPDLVCPTSNGVYVALGSSAVAFGPGTYFGAGAQASAWSLGDVDGDQRPDLLCADRSSRSIQILWNTSAVTRRPGLLDFAVGSAPSGIACIDVNGDSLLDVAVANSGSSSLSLLVNRGAGIFEGPLSYDIPDEPSSIVAAQSAARASRVLVTTHPSRQQVGVVSVSARLDGARAVAVPTGLHPTVLRASLDPRNGNLAMVVRYGNGRGSKPALSVFEQISESQFIEHSFEPNVPTSITGLTVGPLRPQGGWDVVFVAKNRRDTASAVYYARSTSPDTYGAATRLFSFSDSSVTTRAQHIGDVDGDGLADIVFIQGPPVNRLGVALGKGDGVFSSIQTWYPGVRTTSRYPFYVQDVNGDRLPDAVFLDPEAESIRVAYGNGAGSFSSPVTVAPARGVTSFLPAALLNNHECDLVVARGSRHIVTVIPTPFRP